LLNSNNLAKIVHLNSSYQCGVSEVCKGTGLL